MSGSSIGITFNIGYPGSYAKNGDYVSLTRGVKSADTNNVTFGDPVVLNSDNTISKFVATNTAAQFAGIAMRIVKQAQDYYSPAGYYKPGVPADFLTRGGICVTVNNGTPTAGGAVYIRTVAGTLATPVGGFEAAVASDGGTTILLTNAVFTTGSMDSNNIAEITILSRQA